MGIFSSIFGGKKDEAPLDYGFLKTDIHSHLIPGIDDGAKTIEDSLQLIQSFIGFGYTKLITTPHIMSDFYRNTPDIILRGLEQVQTEVLKNNLPIKIEAAAEYYLDADFESKLRNEKLLTFGDNYLLFEISYLNEPEGLLNSIFEIQMKGYKPVLAHPERYPYFYKRNEIFDELTERGVLLQVNINSLSGHYGPGAVKTAESLIKKQQVSFLGSDCHHTGHINLMHKTLNKMHPDNFLNLLNLSL